MCSVQICFDDTDIKERGVYVCVYTVANLLDID